MQKLLHISETEKKKNKRRERLKFVDIYDSLNLLYILSRCIGLAPYTLKNVCGKIQYETSNLGTSYSILFMLSYAVFFIYANSNYNAMSFMTEFYDNSKVANFIDTFQWYATVTLVVVLILSNCCQQNKIIDAVNQIALFDQETIKYGQEINDSQSKELIIGTLLFQTIGFIIMESLNCSLFLLEMKISRPHCYILCYIPLIVSGMIKGQFSVFVQLIQCRFELINSQLRGLAIRRPVCQNQIQVEPQLESSKKLLKFARKSHAHLCRIGWTFNKALSLQIFCFMAHNYISFTANSYFCIESYIKNYMTGEGMNYSLFATVMWALLKLLGLMHLSLICTRTKNKAYKTAIIIHKIKNRHQNPILSEVAQFSKQILHFNFKFTAFDLFDIDMSVFYLMVTSAATYLIILIQMDLALNNNYNYLNFNGTFLYNN